MKELAEEIKSKIEMKEGYHVKEYGQQEWEDYMAIFQQCAEGATSDEKWQVMERMFYLYEKDI